MRMENNRKRSKSNVRRRGSRTLILGLLAGSVLAGVGSYEALAEELANPTTSTNSNTLDVSGKEEGTVQSKAEQLLKDIQKGKEDKHNLLTKKGSTYTLSEDFSKKVESSIGYEEAKDEDTDTVKRLKSEQKSLSALIKTKYEEAKSLGGVVQVVRGESLGSGTLTNQVAVNEGEERLAVLTGELEALVAVKGILDTDLGDAKNIENEIQQIEEQIRKQLEEMLGGQIEGELGISEDGTLNVSGDYIEYLNTLESNQGALNVRSSFVHQTTKDSKVLASYYGQSKDLDSVIAEGFKYLSMPYVWGGESVAEGGFDCSGLMQRIFKDTLGIDLPRVSQDQQNFGKQIPLDEIQPGDLVFWNTPATHVALYLGDGKIMEAANPQAGLRVRDVRLSELSSATRVTDFGVADKGSVVHITNAKRTVSYTPVLNREQSTEYNQAVSNTKSTVSEAEINAKVKEIERKAREEQAKVEQQDKAKVEQAKQDKAKAESAKKQTEKERVEKEAKEKQKAEEAKLAKEKADKAKADEASKKAEAERLAKEKAEKDKADKELADKDKQPEPTPTKPEVEAPKEEVVEPTKPEVEKPKVEAPVQDSKAPEAPQTVVEPVVEDSKPEPKVVEQPQDVEPALVETGTEEVVQE